MKHIIFYSGGLGSWMSAKRVVASAGVENVSLLFTDTFIEDEDLYRFLIETSAEIYGIEDVSDLVEQTNHIPNISKMEERKAFLLNLADEVMERIPQFNWYSDGRDVWEVMNDERFMSNSRTAHCSKYLKQVSAKTWIEANTTPAEYILHLGIDWTEEHRKDAPTRNWSPYKVGFPMCEEPLLTKEDMSNELQKLGIELPRLYKYGFSHNNCGGFCVRAGQGHFVRLLQTMPERYAYHEQREQELLDIIQRDLGKVHTMMKKQVNNEIIPYSLKQLREDFESKERQMEIDLFDIGGCGCFVNYDSRRVDA